MSAPAPARRAARQRSWWGWGVEEAALSPRETDELLTRVRTLLPDAELSDHAPPDPRSLAVAEPRVRVPGPLAAIASTDVVDRLAHARGKAFRDVVRNLHGDVAHVPDAVLRPREEADVVAALEWCGDAGVALVPYGGGSSVVGGVEPRFDGPAVTLDLELLEKVVEIDPVSRAARIQGGIYGPALEERLRPDGLTLRHFPQSFEYSTLGGWLATRAGGHFATLYTHIDDLTESIRVVTPSGVSESRRLPGSGAGPSPDRLFLGSEGTLGVITEAWMRLQHRPRWQVTASLTFTSYADAVTATRLIAQSGLFPTNCRLLDPGEALLSAGVQTTGGVLVLGFESADHPVDAALDRALEIARSCGGTLASRRSKGETADGADGDPAGNWRAAFLRMPYQRDVLARHAMIVETFETACTWDRFDELHAAITAAATDALADLGATGVLTCRFTHVYPDGPAPYFGVYAAGRWGSTLAQWDQIKAAVSEAINTHGGTITHHHAVGRDHLPWYVDQRPDVVARAFRGAKEALDPAGILNPGVLFPADLSGRRPRR